MDFETKMAKRLMKVSVILIGSAMASSCSTTSQQQLNPQPDQDVSAQLAAVQEELDQVRGEVQSLQAQTKRLTAQVKNLEKTPKAQPRAKRQPDTTVYDINLGESPSRGPSNAAVTIVEFLDIQCPYCVREYPKIQKILEEYPDKVRFVPKHFPLRFHKKAKPAHAAMELAKRQKGPSAFWQMHDMIMAQPKKLDTVDLRGYAESLEMDLQKFDSVMADDAKIDELLKDDLAEAAKCKVRGTPTVLINGLKLTDRTEAGYKGRIDTIINATK